MSYPLNETTESALRDIYFLTKGFQGVPANQSLLSPNCFRMVFDRFPSVNFFTQTTMVPGVNANAVRMANNTNVDHFEVSAKVEFEALTSNFLVDEDMENYRVLFDWMMENSVEGVPRFSDMTVIALTNNKVPNIFFKYHNSFPIAVTPIDFDTKGTEDEVIMTNVVFQYSHFTIGKTSNA